MSRARRWAIVLTLGIVGYVIRAWILRTPSGELNADEAFTGLQALEIAKGDFPIVYRGIGYTGVIDSYVFAPFAHFFGAPVVALKLLTSLWWIATSVVMFLTVRSIQRSDGAEHPERWAFTAAAFMWLTPGAMMIVTTRAWEAYGLLLLATFAAAVLLRRMMIDALHSRRLVLAAGATMGAAFYLHPMTLASVIPMALVPCWTYRREFRRWWVPALGAALAVIRVERERSVTRQDPTVADLLEREVGDEAVRLGADPATLRVETEFSAREGRLRAVATGAHPLSARTRPLDADEVQQQARQVLGDQAQLVFGGAHHTLFVATRVRRSLLRRTETHAALVLDGRGVRLLRFENAQVLTGHAHEALEELRTLLQGRAVAPRVAALTTSRLRDYAHLHDPALLLRQLSENLRLEGQVALIIEQ